jgi:hypothetical protein
LSSFNKVRDSTGFSATRAPSPSSFYVSKVINVQQKRLDKEGFYIRMQATGGKIKMLLTQLISTRELASLSEHQIDVLVSALDAEILQNAAIRKQLTSKAQELHRGLTGGGGGGGGAANKKGGGGATGA